MVLGGTVIAHFDFGLIMQMLSCRFRNYHPLSLQLAVNRKFTDLASGLIEPMRHLNCR